MANGRVNEAGYHLARWYRHAWGGQAHPTREVLYQELAVRAETYRRYVAIAARYFEATFSITGEEEEECIDGEERFTYPVRMLYRSYNN